MFGNSEFSKTDLVLPTSENTYVTATDRHQGPFLKFTRFSVQIPLVNHNNKLLEAIGRNNGPLWNSHVIVFSVKLDIFESAVWALKVDINEKFYLI